MLEEPLKPGNYQIVLRSTAPDNVVAMSVETAVVSVPETKDGQVLALVEEPGKPSEMITVPEPEAPAGGAQPPAKPPAAAAPPAEPKPGEQVEAALPPPARACRSTRRPPLAAGPHVVVQAVEIDGRKIFVAGAADPGRIVRGYANEILLGDAKASPDGRYLIEAERDLPVGDYIIRVDALEPDGVKVAARAAVPFEREPGELIAAVAPPAPTGSVASTGCGNAACPATPLRLEAPDGDAAGRCRSNRPEAPAATAEAPPAKRLRLKRLPRSQRRPPHRRRRKRTPARPPSPKLRPLKRLRRLPRRPPHRCARNRRRHGRSSGRQSATCRGRRRNATGNG